MIQNDACAAMGKTIPTFAQFKPSLKQRPIKREGSRAKTEYFIPYQMMTLKMQKAYKDQLVEYDDDAKQVEEILGDVTDGIEVLPTTSAELNEARLNNIRARTAMLEEKLEAHKTELWAQWNEEVFEEFSEAFAKVKNTLISLHLNEEQINLLNDGINDSLKSLKDRLDSMLAKFKNSEEDDEE